MKALIRAHVYVSGIVQGVFFRAHTRDVARSLNLTGQVRNLRDGRVEVIAEGPRDTIERFIEWCHEGPPGARVDNVEIHWDDATDQFKNFEISY